MPALVNGGGTFHSATGGTFHSDMPGTFESDMGGTFNVMQSGIFSLYAKRGAERPRVSYQSALAQREESRSGVAISGVRRRFVPRRTEQSLLNGDLA